MGKVIFWLVVFFVVLLALRIANAAKSRERTRESRKANASAPAAMIRCVDCGVYLPSADAKASPRGPLCGDPQCLQRHGGAPPT